VVNDIRNDDDGSSSNNNNINDDMMLAFVIRHRGDKEGHLTYIPKPTTIEPGFALIQVLRAGICNTDLEILKGYVGFTGVLGHEFVGTVQDVNTMNATFHKEEWINEFVVISKSDVIIVPVLLSLSQYES
jgi:NADPH:quinone reductase-like Zn-dependent oxidoreductase